MSRRAAERWDPLVARLKALDPAAPETPAELQRLTAELIEVAQAMVGEALMPGEASPGAPSDAISPP